MHRTGVLSCVLVCSICGAQAAKYRPTLSYQVQNIEGWTVHVSPTLLEERKELGEKTLKQLRSQLYAINRVVPKGALEKLHAVAIWVEAESSVKCMCYHPSQKWLEKNGFNPEKAQSVELGSPANFLKWTTHQPWMVLHELAHAYHHRVLGWDNPEVRAAFKGAKAGKTYESVFKHNGKTGRAYAMNNHKEYFAELSEAYFGTNDWYPFVRAEIMTHDPEGLKMLGKLWGE